VFQKPLIPSHFSIWYEPPDESGDEILRIVSQRRSLTLKGRLFREFNRRVRPMLDGRHSMAEIVAATADVFSEDDLSSALSMLANHGIVIEAASEGLPDEAAERMMPQLNWFHEMTEGGRVLQQRLASAEVAILGLGGAGATTALGLAAAGVGRIVCVDAEPLAPPDLYFSPFFSADLLGRKRADAFRAHVSQSAPQVEVAPLTDTVGSEEELWQAIEKAHFVISCLDAGMVNLAYKLNRLCLRQRKPWLCVTMEGAEVSVGPVFSPPDGPCFMCCRMRAIACAANPEAGFLVERHLDRAKADRSSSRESLVFGAGIAANIAGLETVKLLTGAADLTLVGRMLTVGLQDLRVQKHTVLKKPSCPACSASGAA